MTVYASTGKEKVQDGTAVLKGAMRRVGIATAAGAQTTLTISGLDLDAHEAYIVKIELSNPTGSAADLSLYYNADTTAGNYDVQLASYNSTTGSFARANNSVVANIVAGTEAQLTLEIRRDFNARVRATGTASRRQTTTLNALNIFHHWRTASTNVTGITLSMSVASSIASGSSITVWAVSSEEDTAHAEDINYDPTTSGLTATNVQDALDEIVVNAGFRDEKVQGSDLVHISSTTYVDSDLVVDLPEAGTYIIELCMQLTNHSTPDTKVRWNYTGTAPTARWAHGVTLGSSYFPNFGTAFGNDIVFTSSAAHAFQYWGTIVVVDAGTLSIQCAQNASSVNPVTAPHAGAYLKVRKVP